MFICFSAIGSGYANNGGSKTILSCANVLSSLGHDVSLATTVYDFTWFKVNAKRINHLPADADVIIATAVSTVNPLAKFNTKAKKFWYVRGWETWNKSYNMAKEVQKLPVIVNSEWLQKKVAKFTKKPNVIYPGIDGHYFPQRKIPSGKICIGGLYNSKGLKRFKLWSKIVMQVMKIKDVNIKLFGDEKRPKLPFEFDYVRRPTPDEHRDFYNSCDIWLFTSENEGLHIPPMEAGACGCALVGSDIGGVRDYAMHGETALLGDDYVNNIIRLIDDVEFRTKLVHNLGGVLADKIGCRRGNMKRLVKVIGG